VVLRWVRKYEHGGIEELTKETRGRKGRPKNAVFSSVEEELEQVKMERDLLKKVSTLRKKLIKG
jgi:transposase-like protein